MLCYVSGSSQISWCGKWRSVYSTDRLFTVRPTGSNWDPWPPQRIGSKLLKRGWSTVGARERCRISPPRFLAECCKRQLNQGSFVLLYFRLFTFSDLYWVCLSVFSCTVLFVSISQVIGCEDCLQNDLYCVEWGVKLYSNQFLQYLALSEVTPE